MRRCNGEAVATCRHSGFRACREHIAVQPRGVHWETYNVGGLCDQPLEDAAAFWRRTARNAKRRGNIRAQCKALRRVLYSLNAEATPSA